MTRDDPVALMRGRSYFLTADEDDCPEPNHWVREVTAPPSETFELPYMSYCYRAHKL